MAFNFFQTKIDESDRHMTLPPPMVFNFILGPLGRSPNSAAAAVSTPSHNLVNVAQATFTTVARSPDVIGRAFR